MANGDSSERQLATWEKRFYGCVTVAFGLLFVQQLTEMEWLDWPRAACWVGAGWSSIQIGKVLKRAGQDGAVHVMRGLACWGLALVALV